MRLMVKVFPFRLVAVMKVTISTVKANTGLSVALEQLIFEWRRLFKVPSLRRAAPEVFVDQDDAYLDQANPVSGTKYAVLDTTKNVKIYAIFVYVVWTVQPLVEVHVTIDGKVTTFTKADCITATAYYAKKNSATAETDQGLDTTDYIVYSSYLKEGQSVKVEAESTGGTVSSLKCRVKYAKKP